VTVLPVGLSSYSFNVTMGYGRAGGSAPSFVPWTVDDLIDQAAGWGLSSVELPLRPYVDQPEAVARSRRRLQEHGLRCTIADAGIAHTEAVTAAIPLAASLGASALRVTLSDILCGDRRRLNGGWRAYLEQRADQLRAARSVAQDCGITIAVENHQDIDSRELVWLCEYVGPDVCAVCLDIANPLAVAEDIEEFTRRVGPHVRNVHLKDYRIYPSPQGYRLVRCALGQGALNWPRLFAVLDEVAPDCTKHIELGAVQARHVLFLEDEFWPDYLPRPLLSLLPVLRLRETQGRPAGEDWQTPHERGESPEARRSFELAEMEESVRYLGTILPNGASN
jgi:sugar phosphate isomerase/epimerase